MYVHFTAGIFCRPSNSQSISSGYSAMRFFTACLVSSISLVLSWTVQAQSAKHVFAHYLVRWRYV